MEYKNTFNCSICKKEINNEWGNNPYPVTQDGECCDKCNDAFVIPARLGLWDGKQTWEVDK